MQLILNMERLASYVLVERILFGSVLQCSLIIKVTCTFDFRHTVCVICYCVRYLQWHQLGHIMQICTSPQTDSHASTVITQVFYRPDDLPATYHQQRQSTEGKARFR